MELKKKEQGKNKNRFNIWKFLLANKLLTAIGMIALLMVVVLGIGKSYVAESKTTKLGFEDIGELATQSAYVTEVNVTKAARNLFGMEIPFTQSKYVYSYDVNIKAGFNFNEIEWKEMNHVIEVKLPEAKILSTEIDMDSCKIYHEDESIFRQITLSENNKALAELKKNAEKDAISNGLLENAYENAEKILTPFFEKEYDLKEYKIKFIKK